MSDFISFAKSVEYVKWLDFKKIFSWSYLSDNALSLTSPLMALLGYIFLFIIIVGVILTLILNKKNKKMPIYSTLSTHINNMTLWLGIIGLIFVLARFQGIYLLSNRILMFLNILGIIGWTGWIVYYSIYKLPKLRDEYLKLKAKAKYLPKKKNRKIRL